MPGSYYHLHHLGFDYRRFRKQLNRDFQIVETSASPFPIFGVTINSELHFVVLNHADPIDAFDDNS